MPTFPTYRGELPARLSPLNPRHYLLLAYWVFFRPTALKCYLYQAAPEVYRSSTSGLKNLRHMFGIPAYRNLWLMLPVLAVMLSLPLVLLASWAQGTSVNWVGVA
ncbi:hypothetical protein K2Z83_27920, partial [Oscillochloris sp. ZM17-4]|uniref:hypothetical protein n=1 Tax=Oscillochloris sp. ZM17-4 TaxID=2866714 RepID=UPI001C73B4E6